MMIRLIRWLRRNMYRNARALGDVQAVATGRIVYRIVQRKAGAMSRRALNKVTRSLIK
jgi:hypothetical protein